MFKFKNVCMDCSERAVGCHSVCKKYLEAKAEHDIEKEKAMKMLKYQDDL